MTTRVLLVRHGSHDLLGKVLCGRMEGVSINAAGLGEARAAARRLQAESLAAVYTSPRQRCVETASCIGGVVGHKPVVAEALEEIDFGDWNGASFADLEGDADWDAWNSRRGSARPPNGESMAEVQARLDGFFAQLAERHPGESVAAISHSDVIKAALCRALDLPLDRYDRFDVNPGSISTLLVGDWGMKAQTINEAAA